MLCVKTFPFHDGNCEAMNATRFYKVNEAVAQRVERHNGE
jgi:hypothetical protein